MTDRDDYPANPYRGRAHRGGGDDYDPLSDPLPAQPPPRGRRARPEPSTDPWADPSASGERRHTGPSTGEFRTPRYASPAAGDYSELYPSDSQPRPQPGRRRRAEPPAGEAPWSGEQSGVPPRRFGVADAVRGSRAARVGDQGAEPGIPPDTGSHQSPGADPTQDALAALADMGGSPADSGDRRGPGRGPVDAMPPEEPPRRPRRARAEEPEQAPSPLWGDDPDGPTPAFLADTPEDEPKGRRARRKRAKQEQEQAETARDTGSFAASEQEEPAGRRGRRRARRASGEQPRGTGTSAAVPADLPEVEPSGSGAFALPEDDEPVGRRGRRRNRRAEPEPEPEPEAEDTSDQDAEEDGRDEDDYEEERLEDIAAAYGNSRANRKRAKKAKAAQAARRSRGRPSRRKRKGPMILLALVLMLVIAGGGFGMRTFVFPPDFDGEGDGEVVITVDEGQSGSAVAQMLVDEGVVASARSFTNALSALPDEEEGDGLVPGTYSLAEGMSGEHAVAALLDSDNSLGGRVTLREGLRGTQILQELADSTGVPVEEFQEAYARTDDLGLPDYADEGPEGYLFPATYSFEPDTEPIAMLRTMVTQYDQVAEEADLEGRAAELGYDPNEAMAIAAIVQAESGNVDDMAKVSRVVHNRLDIDMPLQMDSTCFYAIGEYGIALDNDQLSACEEDTSGFDTYHQTGLIPGPFVAPGEDAIEAALAPEDGDWLYFVATDPENGVTEFTDSHDEFEILKERFQENWGGGEGAEEGGE